MSKFIIIERDFTYFSNFSLKRADYQIWRVVWSPAEIDEPKLIFCGL